MDTTYVTLNIDKNHLDSFCQKLVKRSRDTAKTHDTLATLEAFITQFNADSQATNEYKTITSTLQHYTDHTRQKLLAEKAEQLVSALRHMDREGVARVHTPLSRNGFYEILQTIPDRFTQLELSIINQWAEDWLVDARHKAEQASGYPDAMDFKKAGIRFEEFQAMNDINHYLASVTLTI